MNYDKWHDNRVQSFALDISRYKCELANGSCIYIIITIIYDIYENVMEKVWDAFIYIYDWLFVTWELRVTRMKWMQWNFEMIEIKLMLP